MTRRLLLLTLLALGALVAPASANPVNVGSLDWTQTNLYVPGGTNPRTFLGFVADNRNSPGAANGTAAPEAPATGPTVDGNTPNNANSQVTHSFRVKTGAGSAFDFATRTGTLELDGLLRFKSTKFDFDITLNDPQMVLTGTGVNGGKLFANGTSSSSTTAAPATYNRSVSVFDLDLSAATYAQTGNQVTISNIVPRVTQTSYVFFANYPAGSGPDRVPATFGSFSATLTLGPNITVTPAADIPSSGQSVTVSGTGASKSGPGLYIFLAPAGTEATDSNIAARPPGFRRLEQSAIAADGSFSTTLTASSPFTSIGGTAYDCVLTPCGVRTVAGEFVPDRSQDTFTPVTFRQTYAVPTPTASVTPPIYAPPPVRRPVLSAIKLKRSKVTFRLSRAARVTGSVKRKGKVDGKKVKRSVNAAGRRGANSRKLNELPDGRYTVRLKPKGGNAKTKTVRLGKQR